MNIYNQSVRNPMSAQDKIAEAARLRDQLRSEIIESKKLCSYEPHECRHVRVENYNYCQLHILEDENAPFKQCSYIYNSTGKKCYMPAAKNDNKLGYCNEHIKRSAVAKNKTTQKVEPVESAETILHSLVHYVKPPSGRHRTQSSNSDVSNRARTISNSSVEKDEENTDDETKITKNNDPLDIDTAKINASCNEILEYASESESDTEPTIYNNVWHSQNADLSDNESIDSECEDPLKHAEIYTAEEVCSLTRDKLVRLQDLYIDQFRYLQRVLREKRRKYLIGLKKEKETLASIHNQVRDNPKEYRLYQKLKSLNSYQKRSGVEAILQKRVNDMRAKLSTDGNAHKQPPFVKCLFTEGGVKCGSRALPHAKHCLKHILNDPMQVLFRACGVTRGDADMTCHEPVPDVFPGQACVYHTDIPSLRSYTHMKRDEDDLDSSSEIIDTPKTLAPTTSSVNKHVGINIFNSSSSEFLHQEQQKSTAISALEQSQHQSAVATTPTPVPDISGGELITTTTTTSDVCSGGVGGDDDESQMFDMLNVVDNASIPPVSNVEEIQENVVTEDMQMQMIDDQSEMVVESELEIGSLE